MANHKAQELEFVVKLTVAGTEKVGNVQNEIEFQLNQARVGTDITVRRVNKNTVRGLAKQHELV